MSDQVLLPEALVGKESPPIYFKLPEKRGVRRCVREPLQQLGGLGLLRRFMIVHEVDEHVGVNRVHEARLPYNGVRRIRGGDPRRISSTLSGPTGIGPAILPKAPMPLERGCCRVS
jgi:hypothetical protein